LDSRSAVSARPGTCCTTLKAHKPPRPHLGPGGRTDPHPGSHGDDVDRHWRSAPAVDEKPRRDVKGEPDRSAYACPKVCHERAGARSTTNRAAWRSQLPLS
jgi:hypothetical protein